MSRRKANNSDHDNESEEVKAKNMTYYDVLGVSSSANLSEIKKQFRQLAIKYHPDHRETGDASIFALVARAYECLSSEAKREEYDKMLELERKARKNDYINQKKAFEDFIKAQEVEASSADARQRAKISFDNEFENSNRKRGLVGSGDDRKIRETPLATVDAMKRMKEIELEREEDEIEYSQPQIFTNPTQFDKDKFNALFELKYKSEKDNQITAHNGKPSAFNGIGGASSYSAYDQDYGEAFEQDDRATSGNMYSAFADPVMTRTAKITPEDVERLKISRNEYDTHNTISTDYRSDVERRLKEREQETQMYESRQRTDYDNSDQTLGGYGFLHQVGLNGRELEWDKEELDEVALRKLMAKRGSSRLNRND